MKLPQLSVNRPVTIAMLFIGILLFGIVSLFQLPLDLMPDMEMPVLSVITVYPGASAIEVEKQVSKEIESALAGTEGMKNISSVSKENISIVKLEFNWGTNLDNAANSARDMLEMVSMKLPDDVMKPTIYRINSSVLPVLIYGITAQESFPQINQIIDDDINPRLKKIDGVASSMEIAVPKREIKIHVDPEKLKAYGLSVSTISTILQAENITIPGGNIKAGANDISLSIPGEFESIEELKNCAVSNFQGKMIRLKDVATLKDEFKEMDIYTSSADKTGILLMVQKQSDANTVEVARKVREEVENLRQIIPEDMEINELLSTDELVVHAIRNLSETIMYSLIFVMLVVLFFLRDWKGSLVVFLTIPFSMIVAFIFMFAAGWTINIFSLISLIIALGMVVDAAIVVYENITQHIERGEKPRQAAMFGTSEMGMAITASTATTVSVFLPMVFMGGIAGIMFKQLAILVAITLAMSLFTSMTLTPMISSVILKPAKNRRKHGKIFQFSEKLFVLLENGYRNLLHWTVRHNWVVILLVAIVFAVTLYMVKFVNSDYIPNMDSGDIVVSFETEIGTSAEETNRVANKVKAILAEIPERREEALFSIAGQTEDGLLTTVGFDEGKNVGTVGIKLILKDKRERTAAEIGAELREKLDRIPEITSYHMTAGSITAGALLGNVKPIEVEITGNSLEKLNTVAQQVQDKLESLSTLKEVTTTVDKGKQEYKVQIDRVKASEMGLNAMMIGMQVRQAIFGVEAGEYSEEGEEFAIKVRYGKEYRKEFKDIGNIMLTTLTGNQVPLSSVATVIMDSSPLSIDRKSQQRIVKVKADMALGVSLSEAAAEVEQLLTALDTPIGVDVELRGQLTDQGSSFDDLGLIFLLGIALVYMVMAAQFESFKNPFIILFAIPLTVIGIIWSFLLTGITLSLVSFIGAIMLIGIVVNNGIVLIDYTGLLRKRGEKLLPAVVEAGRSRLRPVLMTSLTTILAMVPMATSTGMGSEMFVPIGVTMIGGLIVSTLITLVFVPSLYVVFNRKNG